METQTPTCHAFQKQTELYRGFSFSPETSAPSPGRLCPCTRSRWSPAWRSSSELPRRKVAQLVRRRSGSSTYPPSRSAAPGLHAWSACASRSRVMAERSSAGRAPAAPARSPLASASWRSTPAGARSSCARLAAWEAERLTDAPATRRVPKPYELAVHGLSGTSGKRMAPTASRVVARALSCGGSRGSAPSRAAPARARFRFRRSTAASQNGSDRLHRSSSSAQTPWCVLPSPSFHVSRRRTHDPHVLLDCILRIAVVQPRRRRVTSPIQRGERPSCARGDRSRQVPASR